MARRKPRKPRENAPVDFDMTPMIDVTFQLLIFFILTMKVIPKERQAAAYLPEDEGPAPTEAAPKDQLTLRMFWRGGEMTYEVNFKFGNNDGRAPHAIQAGTLQNLIDGRRDASGSEYRRIHDELLNRLREMSNKVPKAEKIEVAMDQQTKVSSALHIGETSPWGFVTLALDVCTKLNMEREAEQKKPMSVTFKNTSPAGQERIAGK